MVLFGVNISFYINVSPLHHLVTSFFTEWSVLEILKHHSFSRLHSIPTGCLLIRSFMNIRSHCFQSLTRTSKPFPVALGLLNSRIAVLVSDEISIRGGIQVEGEIMSSLPQNTDAYTLLCVRITWKAFKDASGWARCLEFLIQEVWYGPENLHF